MAKRKRTFTTTCVYCTRSMTLSFRPPKQGIGCGQGECIARHNAAVEAARKEN